MNQKISQVLETVLLMAALFVGQKAWAENTWTVSNPTGSTFRIERSISGTTETVKYRTVNLSAYAGQHYTAKSGEVTFNPNDTYKDITVTEGSPTTTAYTFQTSAKRKYRFEVTDIGGFYLHHCDREITTGTAVTNNNVFGIKDVVIENNEYTANDRGYLENGCKYVVSSSYFDVAAPKAYYQHVGANLRMTLSFKAKENDDAYEYLQILFDNTTTCDNRSGAGDGNPGTPSRSSYMAGFEINNSSQDASYKSYSFPVTTVGSDASATNPWNHGTAYPLTNQKFKSGSRADDGRLIVPLGFSQLVLRLNASGKSGSDEWAVKEVKAHIQALETNAPTVLSNSITVAPGRYSKGNTVYVSVAFNEIVTVSGTPKLTTTSNNHWGDLNYVAGSGTNVLTFSTTIPANASGNLNITGLSGTVEDLAGNDLSGSSVTASNLCTLDDSYAYPITYNLDEGTLPDGYPTSYTWETATITLNNPTKTGYWFNGWTGSNGNTPNTTVTIANHSHGNKSYTANWTNVWGVRADVDGSTADKAYTITTTQGLDLLAQYVNSGNETSGKFFQLGGPINYTHGDSDTENNYTAIGTFSNPFKGTFDGNNNTVSGIRIYSDNSEQGLFGYVRSGGTVKRVNLTDARITGFNSVGGIASSTFEATIEDCIVGDDVCIHTVANNANYHGGIVGWNQAGPVRRCISRARLTVADGKTGCKNYGGIAAYNYHGTISDCIADGVVIPDVNGRGAITGYQNNNGTLTRNYYRNCKVASESVTPSGVGMGNSDTSTATSDVTTDQGALPLYAITLPANPSLVRTPAIDPTLPGTGNATYISGADINSVPYAYATATLNLSYSTAALSEGYTVTISAAKTTGGASVAVTDNRNFTYNLTMPAADVTVTATPANVWGVSEDIDGSTAAKAYTITTTAGLNLLAALVNNGEFRNFEGKFFKLGNDITYTHGNSDTENNYTAIGGNIDGNWRYFCGTFDGQGHTVRGIRINKDGTASADNYQGLFGMTMGATIKNVILADARITGWVYVGGIVGFITRDNGQGGIVENCRVGNDVTIHAVDNYASFHGGVVGFCNGGTVRGCVSAATLTAPSEADVNDPEDIHISYYGGIVGRLNGNMSDCLAIGASVPAVDNNYGAIVGNVNSGTRTNNYHHGCTVGGNAAPSNEYNVSAYTISAGTDVTMTPAGDAAQTYEHNGIQRYGDALYYNGVLYAPKYANVSLTLGNTVTPAELFGHYTATAGTLSGTENPYTLTMPTGDVTINAALAVPYIDEKGEKQLCKNYTLITSSDSYVSYGADGQTNWYVVSGDVTIGGQLKFQDSYSHLIVCDGASLSVSMQNNYAIYGSNGSLTIYGQTQGNGTITANGYNSGINAYPYDITINGCTVSATGIVGIIGNNVTINRGSVTATGSSNRGIDSGNVTINGGTVNATGGSGSDRAGIYASGTITLGWTNATDRITASSYNAGGTISVKSGKTLYNGLTALTGNITASKDDLAGQTLEPGIPFEVGSNHILLDDDRQQPTGYKNTDRINAFNDEYSSHNIMLYGRTLYRDGDWNTLYLPFGIDVNDIQVNPSNPLYGATIMGFGYTDWYDAEGNVKYSYADGLHRSGEVKNGNLHLYFSKEGTIDTCVPYIVKWGTKDSHPATDIVNPVFQNVVVDLAFIPFAPTTDEGPGNVTFRGTFSPIDYDADNHSILLVGMNNSLYWPQKGADLGAFRAYFELGNGITVGEADSQVRGFNLGFGEGNGDATRLNDSVKMLNDKETDAWYTLDGRKLDGQPTARGIYIKNGKKVVIK